MEFDIRRFTDDRLFLFAGHYGSGKSEIAVNFALSLARLGDTVIVDFDIVKSYFRSSGARGALEKEGVRVIAPVYANTNVDVPALPAEISSVFGNAAAYAVFDVGGDGAGAKAVSRYHDDFISERASNFFVFNLRRPMTSDIRGALEIFHEIQDGARLPFTAIVSNTNLLSQTAPSDLTDGLSAALELSARLSLPVAFSAVMETGARQPYAGSAFSEFLKLSEKHSIPVFKLKKYIIMDY